MMYSIENLSNEILKLKKENKSFSLVTLVNICGSAPQDLGAKMLVDEKGLLWGTVGGGKIENQCIEYAKEMLLSSNIAKNQTMTWNLQKEIGMTCGGEVSFLFEYFGKKQSWNVVVFGAGHVAQELVRILCRLDCHIDIVDNREEWIAKIPAANNIETHLVDKLENYTKQLSSHSFIVCMSQGHATDVPVLSQVLLEDYPYVGVIGSEIKGKAIKAELKEKGIQDFKLDSLICPLGLPIGNNSPEEIALSIAAQLLQHRLKVFNY
ncbi:MAG: xanthine dehydrogenase accessory protein XdhC [Halobacteriovoraceae bacterium]|nr:xanthine dehydrogenase accessory protein XdhC [Halobacteriovoraceae bacterium]